ncbi:MAG: hypothetical protein M3P49_06815 [Actinomycetota bacterium]|nr:hypothetical protein [Actinomycetota bacterium]
MLAEERLDDKVGMHVEVPRSVRLRLRIRAAEDETTVTNLLLRAVDEYLSSDHEELAS